MFRVWIWIFNIQCYRYAKIQSPTAASFPITFLDKSCNNITTGDAEDAVIKNRATVGGLQATKGNGASGFHGVMTSPDGRYSVRVFVPNGVHLANAYLHINQIRATE